jgi:AbrB family looped-hinge helix DNA binding protein
MVTVTAQVGAKYQVVIPKEVRNVLAIQPGGRLLFLVDGDVVYVRPEPASYTETLRGLHGELWSDGESWLEQERATWA